MALGSSVRPQRAAVHRRTRLTISNVPQGHVLITDGSGFFGTSATSGRTSKNPSHGSNVPQGHVLMTVRPRDDERAPDARYSARVRLERSSSGTDSVFVGSGGGTRKAPLDTPDCFARGSLASSDRSRPSLLIRKPRLFSERLVKRCRPTTSKKFGRSRLTKRCYFNNLSAMLQVPHEWNVVAISRDQNNHIQTVGGLHGINGNPHVPVRFLLAAEILLELLFFGFNTHTDERIKERLILTCFRTHHISNGSE